MSAIIELTDVQRVFPPSTAALAGVDLIVNERERVAICGPSGSGKSTLLAILGLLDRPTSGTVILDGQSVETMTTSARRQIRGSLIGFVFQAFHLIGHLTALENLRFCLEVRGVEPRQATTLSLDALERVGMSHRAHALPATMSGGEQQRVAIARAVAGNPRLLLCDEPTGNLDSANSQQIIHLLLTASPDSTVVLITHDHEVAEQCDRIVWLQDGRVV